MTALELLELLPVFEARTRRWAAEAVARKRAAAGGLEPVAEAALAERDGLLARFHAASEAWFRAPPAGRAAALAEAFGAVHGREPGRAERRAMARGALGLDGLSEHVHRQAGRLEAEALVAFLAADSLAAREGRLGAGLAGLAVRLVGDPSWRLARAALLGLAAHAAAGRPPPAAALERAKALAAEPTAATWAQVAALELLAAALGPEAAPWLEARLAPAPLPDDRFVRPFAARALARVAPSTARRVLAGAVGDPSEHVRMELAPLLVGLDELSALRRLVDPAREPSWRVRAAAAIALAGVEPAALVAVLEADPDEGPRRVALEEAEPRAGAHPALRAAIERLAVGAPWPELCRLAAEAAERLHHCMDPEAGRALDAARAAVEGVAEGAQAILPGGIDGGTLGRALAVLSTGDFGLQARRRGAGWAVLRGDRMRWRAWRVLHEVANPSPDKRQGYRHTVGRVPVGEVRAPPGGLAEVTATKVPGERVVVPRLGDWGRHLPTVDDLLSRPLGGELRLFSAFGVTRVTYPGGARWLAARLRASVQYARLARLRWLALTGAELRDRREYLLELERLGFSVRFEPYRPGGPAELIELYAGPGAAPPPAALPAAALPVGELLRQWLDPAGSTVNHLAAVAFAALGLFYVRLHEARRELEEARASVPLSIGGWGTRGKSGTERLKAALFQGLGCEVLVKTTGCEAMFIHCLPGLPAGEIFIYRTYDKATIWEQRDLLRLARRLGVDVFLWECMALNPGYVEILEQQWMRDDLCTLTNTYPDHENIQGPAGIDIPRVMTRFIPRGRTLFTAEEQMLPILRDAAAQAGTRLVTVRWRDHALLPADLLARFPYDEHPRNIALVLKLAEALGVDRAMALKEMADWVVPDLGVLKNYPEARWRGRRLAFSNGMSANERTGFLNNWVRCGFDRHGPDEVGEWVVTVVNNRADRVSRSMVFADIVVDDAAANVQVLIGTNLEGLSGFISASLERALGELVLFHADEGRLPAGERERLALSRADRALARVKIGELGASRLAAEAAAMARGLGAGCEAPPASFEEALGAGADTVAGARAAIRAGLESRLAGFAAALGECGAEAVGHLVELTARHAAILRWRIGLRAACGGSAEARRACEQSFRALYREIFLASIVPLWNPGLSGDQVVDAIARACPPGFRVRIMGIQNIKGTGLDFAYRWVHFDRTARGLERLRASRGAEAVRVARGLAEAEEIGVLDCAAAEEAVRAAVLGEEAPYAADLEAVATRIAERRREKEAALERKAGASGSRWTVALERLADIYDGVLRRRRADRVVEELIAGRSSHERAGRALRDLMKRQKGGWLFKRG